MKRITETTTTFEDKARNRNGVVVVNLDYLESGGMLVSQTELAENRNI